MVSSSHLITEYISFITIPLLGLLLCIGVIVLTITYVKSPSHARPVPIGCLFVTILDIYVDIGYLIILCIHFNAIYSDDFTPLLIYSLSLFISILINIIFSFNVFYTQFKFNHLAAQWRNNHVILIVFIRIMSTFDLSLILLLTSKIFNKSWSSAPFHPFIIERIQLVSVISKIFENVPQMYVIIDLLSKLSSWDPDTYPPKSLLSPISITALIVTSIDILITIYLFIVYKRDKHKHPRHKSQTSNVQIYSNREHSSVNYKTPLAGDI
eukprot:129834_1